MFSCETHYFFRILLYLSNTFFWRRQWHPTLAWKIPWMEEPGGPQSMGSLRVGQDSATSLSLSLSCTGEGNGTPLQCSCLENPRDSGAWRAAIYGVAQSRTRLKRLTSSSKRETVETMTDFIFGGLQNHCRW